MDTNFSGFGEPFPPISDDSSSQRREKAVSARGHAENMRISEMVLDYLRTPYAQDMLSVTETNIGGISDKVLAEVKFHMKNAGVPLSVETIQFAAANVAHEMNTTAAKKKEV
jgi:hypothetical protein